MLSGLAAPGDGLVAGQHHVAAGDGHRVPHQGRTSPIGAWTPLAVHSLWLRPGSLPAPYPHIKMTVHRTPSSPITTYREIK